MQEFDNEINTAEYMNMSPAWLRKRRMFQLPPRYLKVGRRVIYSRKEIEDFLRQTAVQSQREGHDQRVRYVNVQVRPSEQREQQVSVQLHSPKPRARQVSVRVVGEGK